ncbi:hypothetical protein [Nakamurella endophytica]|uniref:Uncharacterized protein n=1 Tax=Nakamurella endophytica TaxID=1748367 RepID=A0A917SU50_9ACTN|nr:hypothetical protein [Nakamurella endophytica]GGL95135.1 hypothetical protein GCM10011594_13550 [Nakamurella endophytica]
MPALPPPQSDGALAAQRSGGRKESVVWLRRVSGGERGQACRFVFAAVWTATFAADALARGRHDAWTVGMLAFWAVLVVVSTVLLVRVELRRRLLRPTDRDPAAQGGTAQGGDGTR